MIIVFAKAEEAGLFSSHCPGQIALTCLEVL
jgi:hypothetical protein